MYFWFVLHLCVNVRKKPKHENPEDRLENNYWKHTIQRYAAVWILDFNLVDIPEPRTLKKCLDATTNTPIIIKECVAPFIRSLFIRFHHFKFVRKQQ